MADTGIEIELLHLPPSDGSSFNLSLFYQDVIMIGDDELASLPDPSERFEELLTRCVKGVCVVRVCVHAYMFVAYTLRFSCYILLVYQLPPFPLSQWQSEIQRLQEESFAKNSLLIGARCTTGDWSVSV